MKTALLQEIGLNKSEAKVYLTLLEIGPVTTGPLLSKAQVSSSKIYGILERLIGKGLVSFIIQSKTKYYQAAPPETLLDYMREEEEQQEIRKEKIKIFVNELRLKQSKQEEKQEARIFLGWKGVQNAYNLIIEMLPWGSEFIGFVQPTTEEERKEVKIFYQQYHKKRLEKKYHTKLISNESLRSIFEKEPYSSFRRFEVRYVKNCPAGLVIFGNNILIIAFEKKPVAIVIQSEPIAKSYRNLFYEMWKIARK